MNTQKFILAAAAVLIVLTLSAATISISMANQDSGAPPASPEALTLSGRVTDLTGEPVAGVTISLLLPPRVFLPFWSRYSTPMSDQSAQPLADLCPF